MLDRFQTTTGSASGRMVARENLRQLASRLLDEQRARWERGEPVPVEDYLRQHPELQVDREAVVDLIYQEVLLHQEKGEVPRLSDCIRRFPLYEAELKDQFDLHEVLASPSQRGVAGITGERAPALPDIPGYEIQGELGSGGMGIVYLAYDPRLKRQVAIKVIRTGSFARKEELARFHTEAEAIARLQHPNIAQIYEVGEHQDRPYLVLEHLEGGSLDQLLAGKPQPARAAACLVETLARAIHHAHERGIVHRDLKPGNILLQTERSQSRKDAKEDQEEKKEQNQQPSSSLRSSFASLRLCERSSFIPKITDFGLAKFLVGGPGVTSSGAVLGTASYMPPEQARAETSQIGPATDVYALGAILYEMLTGRPPFQGASAAETTLQVLTEDPMPLRHWQPRVRRDLETICLKCLEKKTRQALRQRSIAGGGFGPFPGRRTDPSPADWRLGARHEMGPTPAGGGGVDRLDRGPHVLRLRDGYLAVARSGTGPKTR
jgi:eukaryotic-like serine/threonine-protein kinase